MPTTTTETPNETGYARDEELSVTAELESSRVLQKIRDKTDAVVKRIQPQDRRRFRLRPQRADQGDADVGRRRRGAGLMALVALDAPAARGRRRSSQPASSPCRRSAKRRSTWPTGRTASPPRRSASTHKRASGAVDVGE